MVRWFRWMTAVNVVGIITVALAMTAPAVFAFFFLSRVSGELLLVPVEPAPAPAVAASVPAAPPPRLEVPPEFRTPDLAARPWDELPDGRIRMRD